MREAQRYDQELERAACRHRKPPPVACGLYDDLVRWRDAGRDVARARYVLGNTGQHQPGRSCSMQVSRAHPVKSRPACCRRKANEGILPSVLTRFLSCAAELSSVGGYIQAVKDALAACLGARRAETSCRG